MLNKTESVIYHKKLFYYERPGWLPNETSELFWLSKNIFKNDKENLSA